MTWPKPIEKWGRQVVVTRQFREDAGVDVEQWLIAGTVPLGYEAVPDSGQIKWYDPTTEPDPLRREFVDNQWLIDHDALIAFITVRCTPDERSAATA